MKTKEGAEVPSVSTQETVRMRVDGVGDEGALNKAAHEAAEEKEQNENENESQEGGGSGNPDLAPEGGDREREKAQKEEKEKEEKEQEKPKKPTNPPLSRGSKQPLAPTPREGGGQKPSARGAGEGDEGAGRAGRRGDRKGRAARVGQGRVGTEQGTGGHCSRSTAHYSELQTEAGD